MGGLSEMIWHITNMLKTNLRQIFRLQKNIVVTWNLQRTRNGLHNGFLYILLKIISNENDIFDLLVLLLLYKHLDS